MLRGIPASGKSTFIKDNNLEDYTISTDQVRKMFMAPSIEWDFKNNQMIKEIDQEHNRQVFNVIDDMLQTRFAMESTTIFDATNINMRTLNKYYKMARKYNYRVYVVDFMKEITFEEAKKRNANRNEMVPEKVLDRMYNQYLDIEKQGMPKKFNVISPSQMADTLKWKSINVDNYRAIKVIGDIHSSATPLKRILKDYNEDTLYVFTGDYFDRGIEPVETAILLNDMLDKKNTIFLEGNHDIYIRNYMTGIGRVGHEFKKHTLPALIKNDINVNIFFNKLLSRLQDVAILDFHGKTIVLTHAGLTNQQLDFSNYGLHNSHYFVKGIGEYKLDIDKIFEQNMKDTNVYQIHGHRNNYLHGVMKFTHSFNLEQKVEDGNKLGCVELLYRNNNLQIIDKSANNTALGNNTWDEYSEPINQFELNNNKYLRSKHVNIKGHVTMYHFNKQAFKKNIWNEQTTHARGLYIDGTNHVIARGFNKFFVMDQHESTTRDKVVQKMIDADKVIISEKLDGFLGIVSYLENEDKLFITSKGNGEDYSNLANDVLTYSLALRGFTLNDLKKVLKKDYFNGLRYSLTFEIIDEVNDPHLVEYPERDAVLLEVIPNTINNNTLISHNMPIDVSYAKRQELANKFKLSLPQEKEYHNINEQLANTIIDHILNSKDAFEGVVVTTIKGNSEFKFKLKTLYFNRIKMFRAGLQAIFGILNSNARKIDYKPENNINFLNSVLNKINEKNTNVNSILDNQNVGYVIGVLKQTIQFMINDLKNGLSFDNHIVYSNMVEPLKKIDIIKTLNNMGLKDIFVK